MKVRLLPFVEQAALFNTVNVTYNGFAPQGQNDTILTTQINTFLCPSDGNIPTYLYTLVNGSGQKQIGYANYPNSIGTIAANNNGNFDGPIYLLGATANTALAQGGTVTLASVTDGTSNTVIFSEWIKGRVDQVSTNGPWQIMVATIAYPDHQHLRRALDVFVELPGLDDDLGHEREPQRVLLVQRQVRPGGRILPHLDAEPEILPLQQRPRRAAGSHDGRGQLEPPRRRERRHDRRLGPLHQEHRHPDDLVGPGHQGGGEVLSADSY